MEQKEWRFSYTAYNNLSELPADEAALVEQAKQALPYAYAPYSNFQVAAAVLLVNGTVVTGTNQENASFPAGICAEGTALSAVSAMHPNVAVKAMAITIHSKLHTISHPVAPCGICRQRILEYENRFNSPIKLILMGDGGLIYTINSVKDILPLNFSKSDM